MPDPGSKPSPKLKHVLVYEEDAEEYDRRYGDAVSFAKRFRANLEVDKRERVTEKVRRKLYGAAEAVVSAAGDVYLLNESHDAPGQVTAPVSRGR